MLRENFNSSFGTNVRNHSFFQNEFKKIFDSGNSQREFPSKNFSFGEILFSF